MANANSNNNIENDLVLSAQSVYHVYGGTSLASPKVVALKGMTVDLRAGEFVSIVGPSGSGKTTLMRVLGGLMKPTAGRIQFREQEITALDESDLVNFRRNAVGFVFQEGNLVPHLTAQQNVTIAMKFAGVPSAARKGRARELLKLLDVDNRRGQLPSRLSGGEKQRVAIARALANNPAVVLCDEPTGNLDVERSQEILEYFKQTNKETGKAFLIVTHDALTTSFATRSIEIRDGLLIGHHGIDIDLSELDTSRLTILDMESRIPIPEYVFEQLGNRPELYHIDVKQLPDYDSPAIILTAAIPSDATSLPDADDVAPGSTPGDATECPVCHAAIPRGTAFCKSCGAALKKGRAS